MKRYVRVEEEITVNRSDIFIKLTGFGPVGGPGFLIRLQK
jgi:hypothetical protein